VPTAEFLTHWLADDLAALDGAWYVWLPAYHVGAAGDADATRALLSTALARQLLALSAGPDEPPTGPAVLRALLDRALVADAAERDAHVSLLAGATSPVDALGGPGLTRRAVAAALGSLRTHAEPELGPLVRALRDAADAWDDVTAAAAAGTLGGREALVGAYRRLLDAETAIVDALAATLEPAEVAC
jgi:hypothetical protein